MPRFEPFAGVRYDAERVEIADVTAPPYDVIGPDDRAALEARSPYNVVHVDLSRDEAGRDRYAAAGCRFDEWLAAGILVADREPAFYAYRMTYRDERGRTRRTTGVIGALELADPGSADVLPHERTMPKPKDDRLNLMRACRANLSPVWCLSLATGLAAVSEPTGPPLLAADDDAGIRHELWRVVDERVLAAITATVATEPVVIADGHHRYETALAYRDEQRAGHGPGDWDLLMAYVVELAEEQLTVRAIHRLVSSLPVGFDLLGALDDSFEVIAADSGAADPATLPARMAEAGALALVTRDGTWLLRPRAMRSPAADRDHELDATRLDAFLATLPAHHVAYQHGADLAAAAVDKGEAQAAFLLRPATVAQIAAAAHAARRMPEKTTFFWPKPRTGLVFRRFRD